MHPAFRPAHRLAALLGVLLLAVLAAGCERFMDPYRRGELALSGGDYPAAIAAFDEAIAEGKYPAESYANRGIANEALHNYDLALADYGKALELLGPDSPERAEVLNNRGVAYLGLRELDKAMADFDAALAIRADYAEAYANRGRTFADQEDYDQAIADFDKALELDDGLAEAYGNRALAYESQGDIDRALPDYAKAIELSHDPQAYFNRGMVRYSRGCFNLAYQDFTEVVTRVDENEYLWYQAKSQKDFLENRPQGEDTCNGPEREADMAAQGVGAATAEEGADEAAGDAAAESDADAPSVSDPGEGDAAPLDPTATPSGQ